jgi:hypothetical protein
LGVLKKIALAIMGSSGGEVFGDDIERLVVRGNQIAVWPVGAEDYAVRAEEVPEGIELVAIKVLVVDEGAISKDRNFRELDVDVRVARENSEIVMVRREVVRIVGEFGVGKVVDDDAELRDALDDAEQRGDKAGVGIGAFKNEAGVGEHTQAVDEDRLAEVCEEIAVPEVTVADAEE